jgi:hypothetical protein
MSGEYVEEWQIPNSWEIGEREKEKEEEEEILYSI